MAFSEFESKRIDKLVGTFCNTRVPEHARKALQYVYRVDGQDVIIAESRPRWDNPDEWLTLDFAKLKYVKSRKIWKLYWMRANGKWNLYEPCSEAAQVETLVAAINEDRHGCFFG